MKNILCLRHSLQYCCSIYSIQRLTERIPEVAPLLRRIPKGLANTRGLFLSWGRGSAPPRPRSVHVNRHLALRVGGGAGVRRSKRFRFMRPGFLQQTNMEFASDGCLDQALLRNSLGRTTQPTSVTIIGNLATDMPTIGGVSFAAAPGRFVIRDFCYMTSVNIVMKVWSVLQPGWRVVVYQ